MKDTLKAIYVVLFLLVGVWCNIRVIEPVVAADKPELKIPLDCYYIKAPDGDRLDNYLNKNKDNVWRVSLRPETTTPYSFRVHRFNPYQSAFTRIKVTAAEATGSRSAHKEWILCGGGTFRTMADLTETPIAPAITITPTYTADGATGYYYIDITVTNCTNGIIRVEVEKL